MNRRPFAAIGIKLLVKKCSDEYHPPEKMNNYTLNGYKTAEKKIINMLTRQFR